MFAISIGLSLSYCNPDTLSALDGWEPGLSSMDNSGEPLIANHQNFALKFNVKFM